MAEFTFDEQMRTGHVTRWQIVRTARQQTIAEHMYRTWLITVQICRLLEVGHETSSSANIWALYHDMPEVLTGDIATPAKEAMRKALPDDDPIRNIELGMSDTYRHAWEDAKLHRFPDIPSAYEIVKLADLIEAKCFLGCEMVGNHAKAVFDGMCWSVEKKYTELSNKYPVLPWYKIQDIINNSWSKV